METLSKVREKMMSRVDEWWSLALILWLYVNPHVILYNINTEVSHFEWYMVCLFVFCPKKDIKKYRIQKSHVTLTLTPNTTTGFASLHIHISFHNSTALRALNGLVRPCAAHNKYLFSTSKVDHNQGITLSWFRLWVWRTVGFWEWWAPILHVHVNLCQTIPSLCFLESHCH